MLLCLPKCFLQMDNEKLNTCSSLIKSRGNLAKLCHHPDGLLGLGNGISLGFGDRVSAVMEGEVHLDRACLAGNNYPIFNQAAKYNLTAQKVLGTTGVLQP